MPIIIQKVDWEIPSGNDCAFSDGRPCPFLSSWEFNGSVFCAIERQTPMESTKRQTWKKTPLCKLRT